MDEVAHPLRRRPELAPAPRLEPHGVEHRPAFRKGAVDDGGPQHHHRLALPRRLPAGRLRLALRLPIGGQRAGGRGRVFLHHAGCAAIDGDGTEMHHAPHARRARGRQHIGGAFGDDPQIVAGRAVDDMIHAPHRSGKLIGAHDVALDHRHGEPRDARRAGPSPEAGAQREAGGGVQRLDNGAAHEAAGAGDQDRLSLRLHARASQSMSAGSHGASKGFAMR